MKKVYSYLSTIQYKLFPGICILCHHPTHRVLDLCQPCEADLPVIETACTICGKQLHFTAPPTEITCGNCLRKKPVFYRCISNFQYQPPINYLISQFKYKNKLIYGSILAQQLAHRIKQSYSTNALPQCLIPVPLHWRRICQRGYNQSTIIAQVLSKELGIPINNNLCKRVRHTPPQMSLRQSERRKNTQDAFQIKSNHLYQSVAIIDDVMTTGSTIIALTKTLKKSGIQNVHVWVLART